MIDRIRPLTGRHRSTSSGVYTTKSSPHRRPRILLEFRHETHDREVFQAAPVVNYPDEKIPHTRITEFKYLTGQNHAQTSIVYEYPQAEGDPYYPIPRPQNAEINAKYQALVNDTPGLYFVGRLASYKYYNMDQVVGAALTLYRKLRAAM